MIIGPGVLTSEIECKLMQEHINEALGDIWGNSEGKKSHSLHVQSKKTHQNLPLSRLAFRGLGPACSQVHRSNVVCRLLGIRPLSRPGMAEPHHNIHYQHLHKRQSTSLIPFVPPPFGPLASPRMQKMSSSGPRGTEVAASNHPEPYRVR